MSRPGSFDHPHDTWSSDLAGAEAHARHHAVDDGPGHDCDPSDEHFDCDFCGDTCQDDESTQVDDFTKLCEPCLEGLDDPCPGCTSAMTWSDAHKGLWCEDCDLVLPFDQLVTDGTEASEVEKPSPANGECAECGFTPVDERSNFHLCAVCYHAKGGTS